MRFFLSSALAALAFTGVLLASPTGAHDGHDHAKPAPIAAPSALARGEAASENFELVAIARGEELEIYLDEFATNAPIEGATIDVETPSGGVIARAVPGAAYTLPAPWLKQAGTIELILTVSAQGLTDILPLTFAVAPTAAETPPAAKFITPLDGRAVAIGAAVVAALLAGAAVIVRRRRSLALVLLGSMLLTVSPLTAHEGEDHGSPAPRGSAPVTDLARRLPDGSVFVPKSAQRIFALRTILTETAPHKRSVELPGRIIPDPNASGFVQAAIGGRLSPPPGGFPRLGTRVSAGDVLAYVTPPLQAIDVSDMRQKQGELDQQIAIAERKLARTETLAPSGAVARSQLEDSRSEVEGLKERRAMLDKSRREPEALIAPVAGVVADGSAVAGQIAQPNAVIFHIIDPGKLWVEALSFDVIAESQEAAAKTAAGKTFKVAYRGSGFADRSQSIPVHFAIEGDLAGLRAGQFVSVLVGTDEAQAAIALPRSSLVRAANGQDVVFEHVSAEIFAARLVRTAPLDGDRVLIAAGLKAGVRVVTQGAELLEHVR